MILLSIIVGAVLVAIVQILIGRVILKKFFAIPKAFPLQRLLTLFSVAFSLYAAFFIEYFICLHASETFRWNFLTVLALLQAIAGFVSLVRTKAEYSACAK